MRASSLAASNRPDPNPAPGPLSFILNPRSGRRGHHGLASELRAFISARSLRADLAVTEGPGHATLLAREAVQRGRERVVAVGGDGTVNEVAQALRHTPAALSIVPLGSGNGLARHLGLPLAQSAALELAAGSGGRVCAIDTGTVNDRAFFSSMGLGLDAEVSRRFNLLTRRGLPAYVKTALAAFLQCRRERCRVTCAGRTEEFEVYILAVANSEQYGNGARLAPGARIDDGQLDLVAIAPVGPLGALLLAARLFGGTLDRSPRVRRWLGARFQIERSAPGPIHTDGEVHFAPASLDVAVHPRSLRVLLP